MKLSKLILAAVVSLGIVSVAQPTSTASAASQCGAGRYNYNSGHYYSAYAYCNVLGGGGLGGPHEWMRAWITCSAQPTVRVYGSKVYNPGQHSDVSCGLMGYVYEWGGVESGYN